MEKRALEGVHPMVSRHLVGGKGLGRVLAADSVLGFRFRGENCSVTAWRGNRADNPWKSGQLPCLARNFALDAWS
jgi:hypothetical protein